MPEDFSFSASVIIPTKGRRESMTRTLASLLEQVGHRPDVEILVLEETDHPKIPKEPRIKYFSIPERGFGFGFVRNLALRKAHGSIIVFLDDDVIPCANWFEAMIAPFTDQAVGAVGGSVLPDLSRANTIGKAIAFLGFPAGGLGRYLEAHGEKVVTSLISAGNCAFRSHLAQEIGGFDEFLRWGGEDQDFFARMSSKSKTLYVPDAIVYHRQRESLNQVFRWFVRRGMAEFCIRSKKQGPLHNLFFPLRRNFLIKILLFAGAVSIIASVSPVAGLVVGLAIPLAWHHFLWQRGFTALLRKSKDTVLIRPVEETTKSIMTKEVRGILGVVKAIMDLGQEVGIYIAFLRYLRNRFFLKPFVLTIHHVNTSDPSASPESKQYYLPRESFRTLMMQLECEGRLVVSLLELVKRLKENHHSLYFSKIACVTFDDAFASVYEALTQLGEQSYPFSVFIPTAWAGGTNEWDKQKGFKEEPIMNWVQLRTLYRQGVEIGSHTRGHVHLLQIGEDELRREILDSMEDLRINLTNGVRREWLLSYPYGEYDEKVAHMVKKVGYAGAVTNISGAIRPRTDPYQIPRFSISANADWKSICEKVRSSWLRDILKDWRDFFLCRKGRMR